MIVTINILSITIIGEDVLLSSGSASGARLACGVITEPVSEGIGITILIIILVVVIVFVIAILICIICYCKRYSYIKFKVKKLLMTSINIVTKFYLVLEKTKLF